MPVVNIVVIKGKGTVAIDTDALPDAVYQAALLIGLKDLANKGMSKITKTTYPNEEELKAAAMAKATENAEAIANGTIKLPGTKSASGKVPGEVMTEARRLAKAIIKEQMKAAGLKVSHYPAKEITAAANALIESDATIIATATDNIAQRKAAPAVEGNILATLKADPKLVAEAEAKKKAGTLSKTQAGKTAPRSKKGKGGGATA